MFYTIYVSNKTGQYYLIVDKQKNPNYWFYDTCLNPYTARSFKQVPIWRQLTIDEFNNIITKYNLGNNWYSGDYDIFETIDKLF